MSKYVGKIVTNQASAGYSVFFDGTGDYLTVANNAAFQLGTGDFTIECWYYAQDISLVALVGLWGPSSSNASWLMYLDPSGNPQWYTSTNGSTQTASLTSSRAITLNAWNHIAFSRSSGTTTIYVNGVSGGSTSTVINLFAATSQLTIGYNPIGGTPDYAVGYISNLRIVKGTALYTAAFTPPTQLLNVTNTSILTCNSPAIVDQSSNAFAITTNGNAAVSTFTPFAAYNPYNPALGASTPGVWTLDEAMQARATRQWNMYDPYFQNTTLLLHGNGTNAAQNNTFIDGSSNAFSITRNGNTTQGTFSPYGSNWSNYFDGTGDYLSGPTNTATAFNLTGDFTIECWAYFNSVATSFAGLVSWADSSGWNGWQFLNNAGTLQFEFLTGSSGAGTVTSSITMTTGRWYHLAVVRSSSTITLYIDGVSRGTSTYSSSQTSSSSFIKVGADRLASALVTGYISNLRVVNGTAVYTAAFTPPTAPLTAITNTSLLTCQSNRFIDNSTNAFTITSNGDVRVTNFAPFAPSAAYSTATNGGSGYFDGSGDYLFAGSNSAFSLGTGDFTFQAWVYPLAWTSPVAAIFDTGSGVVGGRFSVVVYNGGTVKIDNSTNLLTSSTSLRLNEWTLITVIRSGGAMTLYFNGVSVASGSIGTNFTETQSYIGRTVDGYYLQGYISDLRLVKGSALTNAVPTAPLSNVTNTSLLLNFTNAAIFDNSMKNVLETVGNAQISTTQSKFGGSSMYFDGTGDWLLAPNSANLAFNTGDFTVECWVYPTASPSYACIIDTRNGFGTGGFGLFITSGTGLQIFTSSGVTIFTGTSCITTNTWQHVVVCRSGTNLRVFVNGTQIGSTVTNSANMSDGYLIIGNALAADRNYPLTGYIDDLRVTKGVARYTTNFTPQTSQWQDQ